MSGAGTRSTRPRRRTVMAWSVLLASTLALASLFQAVAGSALGGPGTTTSIHRRMSPDVVAAGEDDQGRGPSCAELFGSYNWWLFSSDRQGPCGLGPDATTPIPVQAVASHRGIGDGDDVRAQFLAKLRAQGLGVLADPSQKNCVRPQC